MMQHRNDDPSSEDPAQQAEAVIGAGRGALVVAMFGAGWLGWGLGQARAFNGLVAPTFGFTELVLLACSISVIRRGRLLSQRYAPIPASARQARRRSFSRVVMMDPRRSSATDN